MQASKNALLAALLTSVGVARAAPPARDPVTLREPSWKGGAPALVTPEYREALAKLQAIAASHPQGVRLQVSSPAPCVLRLTRGDDVASFTDAGSGFLHQVTWVDLAKSAELGAKAFGRKPGTGPAFPATCAWLAGAAGLAVSTEVFAPKGSVTPVRRIELAPEEQPRICVGNEVEPEAVAAPLRTLVTLCGGRARATPPTEDRSIPIEESGAPAGGGAARRPAHGRRGRRHREGGGGRIRGELLRRAVGRGGRRHRCLPVVSGRPKASLRPSWASLEW